MECDVEFNELINNLGGENIAGEKLKSNNKQEWNDPNDNSSNSSGFTGLPGGFRNGAGIFYDLKVKGCWWSSTKKIDGIAFRLNLLNGQSGAYVTFVPAGNGFSIRCIKDQ